MTSTPETGFLVIADLSGYTAYLAGSPIEHAPVTLPARSWDRRRAAAPAAPDGE